MKQIAFIGAGNMGSALMTGLCGHADLVEYDILDEACLRAEKNYGARIASSVSDAAKSADIVFAAVKPQFIMDVMDGLKEAFTGQPEKILATIVAGKSLDWWQQNLGPCKIARIMPNTPAMVKEGVNAICFSKEMTEDDKNLMTELLSYTGRVIPMREDLMGAAMGVSGCGPAYVYVFIEAMADAGVAEGLPRKLAYEMAAQTVLGAAKMVLETGRHPADLKDAVCSPGGTTIRGVMALEDKGLRAAVEAAVEASLGK